MNEDLGLLTHLNTMLFLIFYQMYLDAFRGAKDIAGLTVEHYQFEIYFLKK